VQLDHLILAVADLDAGAAALTAATGLAVEPGGVHPDWGTENRIVPLGEAYRELVAVTDPEAAAGAPFGRAVAAAAASGAAMTLMGWAVAPDDLDATAARLGLDVRLGRRTLAGGGTLSWAMAGAAEALPRGLPFFLRWNDPDAGPARGAATPGHVRWVELAGDRAALEAWLGVPGLADVELRHVGGEDGRRGPRRAGLEAGGRELVLPPPRR